jgi:hypothetical protein
MPTKTWKNVNKFRLFVVVTLSLLTSLSLTLGNETVTAKEITLAFLQAGIAGMAYLQCPTMQNVENKGEK